jgi:hypothetical protein
VISTIDLTGQKQQARVNYSFYFFYNEIMTRIADYLQNFIQERWAQPIQKKIESRKYNILIEFGIPMKLVRLIKICLNETYIKSV